MNIFDDEPDSEPVRTGLPGLDELIRDRFEKPHCALIAARLPAHAETLSARIALNAARAGSSVYAAGLDRAFTRILDVGETLPETLHVEPNRLYGGDSCAQMIRCPRGARPYDLAVFGILDQFRELDHDKREEELEHICLEIRVAGDRANCATILTAPLVHEPRVGWEPYDGLDEYDPIVGHADLGLFITRRYGARSEDDLSFQIVKWRHGPCPISVDATWVQERFDFDCPAQAAGGPR